MIDISVLMLFHARADHFGEVWKEVKRAQPARLFLYQDGPRMVAADGSAITDPAQSKDWEGIQACRELVKDENIDWECEVHRLYQEKNYGCDPSGYMSQQWAFSQTDKCMVLEDDVVPSQSFFRFCKEMLDKYENDQRITMIAGFNTEEITKLPLNADNHEADYFFTSVFSIWGWASWARVINNRDGNYSWMDSPSAVAHIENICKTRGVRSDFMRMCRDHRNSGKQYFESIFWSHMLLNNGLAIMPRKNMVNNIGMDGGTHYSGSLATTPRGLRRIFTMQRHELSFPLTHPEHVCEWTPYKESHYRINAWNNPRIKVMRSIEELLLNLRYGNFGVIGGAIVNRIRKTLGLKKHA